MKLVYPSFVLAAILTASTSHAGANAYMASTSKINLFIPNSGSNLASSQYIKKDNNNYLVLQSNMQALKNVGIWKDDSARAVAAGLVNNSTYPSYNGSFVAAVSEYGGSSTRFSPYGQCVAFVKGMTGIPGTSSWTKGANLSSFAKTVWGNGLMEWTFDLTPGTAIAYFPDGKTTYSSVPDAEKHVAVFLSADYTPDGGINGIWVVEQNYALTQGIGKRYITWSTGTGRNNAKNYSVVLA